MLLKLRFLIISWVILAISGCLDGTHTFKIEEGVVSAHFPGNPKQISSSLKFGQGIHIKQSGLVYELGTNIYGVLSYRLPSKAGNKSVYELINTILIAMRSLTKGGSMILLCPHPDNSLKQHHLNKKEVDPCKSLEPVKFAGNDGRLVKIASRPFLLVTKFTIVGNHLLFGFVRTDGSVLDDSIYRFLDSVEFVPNK